MQKSGASNIKRFLHTTTERIRVSYTRVSSHRWFVFIAVGALLLLTFVWGWCLLAEKLGACFSQDSFAYYLLGKNLWHGLGYTTTCARDLSVPPVWPVVSKSFPPLHPVLVGLTDILTGLGLQAASLVSLFYLFGTIVAMYFLARKLGKDLWMLVFFAFVVVFAVNNAYRDEFEEGRSIPGMVLFFLLSVFYYSKTLSQTTRARAFEIATGVFTAAMMLQRFDQTLYCTGFLFCTFFIYRVSGVPPRQSLNRTATILGAFLVTMLPWAIRNTVQFGAPFASDNTSSVFSTYRGLACSAFWLPGREPDTLFTRPEIWLDQRIGYLSRNLNKIFDLSGQLLVFIPLIAAALWKTFSQQQRVFIFLAGIHGLATITTISLTPYGDARYFSLLHLNLLIVGAIGFANAFRATSTGRIVRLVKITLVCVLLYITCTPNHISKMRDNLLSGRLIPNNADKMAMRFAETEEIVNRFVREDELLSVAPNADGFTVFTGRRTVYFPSTMKQSRRGLEEWIKAWHVDYLLLPNDLVRRLGLEDLTIKEVFDRRLISARDILKSR